MCLCCRPYSALKYLEDLGLGLCHIHAGNERHACDERYAVIGLDLGSGNDQISGEVGSDLGDTHLLDLDINAVVLAKFYYLVSCYG